MGLARVLVTTAVLGVALTACGDDPAQHEAEDPCALVITFTPDGDPDRVALVGDFNDWSPLSHRMLDDDGDGVYRISVVLEAGWHRYAIWVDGTEHLDKHTPVTLYDDEGFERSAVHVGDCALPSLVVGEISMGTGGLSVTLGYEPGAGGHAMDEATVAVTRASPSWAPVVAPSSLSVDAEAGTIVATWDDALPGKHWIHAAVTDSSGLAAEPLSFPVSATAPGEDVWTWQDAVVYQIVVDRFQSGDGPLDTEAPLSDYMGGDLYGILHALEAGYFDALGVDTLWISPMYDNPSGTFPGFDSHVYEAYHGYWPSAPRAVEETFGGEEALEALVETLHGEGMHLMVDVVPNHVHLEHPYWTEHGEDGWFNHADGTCLCGASCSWALDIDECWFTGFLPDLDWRQEIVVTTMVDDLLWWVSRFDLDALRVDAVPMMPRLAVRHLAQALELGPEVGGETIFLMGENYTGSQGYTQIAHYLGPHSMEGMFDFPMMWTLRSVLTPDNGVTMAAMVEAIEASEATYTGSGAILGTIIGNHDVPRLMADLSGAVGHPWTSPPLQPDDPEPYERQKLALTFLFGYTGMPILYYGDEVGLTGLGDPDCRRPLPTEDALTLPMASVLSHTQLVGQARRASKALRQGALVLLGADDDVLAFARDAGDGYPAVIILNAGDDTKVLRFDLPASIPLAPAVDLVDVLGHEVTLDGRKVEVSVGARESAMLVGQ